MPRLSPEARLEKAQKDRAEATARLQIAAGQVSAKKRKAETRRKIILGGMIIKEARENKTVRDSVIKRIQKMSERDRKLFEDF